jgi:glutamine amidotransferase
MTKENKPPTIAVINHGMGSWRSSQTALAYIGANAPHTYDRQEILAADGLVLPGVGAFPTAMTRLAERGLIETITDFKKLGKPILGICLGHQLLFEASEEHEYTKGLGFIPGVVRKTPFYGVNMGWRVVTATRETALSKDLPDRHFYHMHALAAEPEDQSDVWAVSPYAVTERRQEKGTMVVGAVQRDNLYGVQFHPEKSSHQGLQLLKNFVEVCGNNQAGL